MREDTQEKINKCLKIKNENPVYSDCYILVTNHYDMEVGLLNFSDKTKEQIDEIVKKAAAYIAFQNLKKINYKKQELFKDNCIQYYLKTSVQLSKRKMEQTISAELTKRKVNIAIRTVL